MPLPSIHLNGSARIDLIRQRISVCDALHTAIARLCEAVPHGRDYYPQGEGAFITARAQHAADVEALRSMYRRFEAEAIAIDEAK